MAGLLVLLFLCVSLLVIRLFAGARRQPVMSTMGRYADPEAHEPPERRPSKAPAADASASAVTPSATPKAIWEEPATTEMNFQPGPRPTKRQATEAESKEPAEAARMWERLGWWDHAARCHEAAGDGLRAATVYLALDHPEKALPHLREALKRKPMEEGIRLNIVQILIDLKEHDQALDLARAVRGGADSTSSASAGFQTIVGELFEAIGRFDVAEEFYRSALTRDETFSLAQQRLSFLSQFHRLKDQRPSSGEGNRSPRMLLQRAAADTGEFDDIDLPSSEQIPQPPVEGHEIIVGHLALGFQRQEPVTSVRSVYSLPQRFVIDGLIGQSGHSAVFKASDRLLDFPVALKLSRLPDGFDGTELLGHRLLAVAHLNHPNLGKLTFVDRQGLIVRTATEYLPGGTLGDFLIKLGGVGLPLIIRMALHITSALHHAHMRGVPHGDLRLQNIMVGSDQRLKLVDFALSPIPVVPVKDDSEDSAGGLRLRSSENSLHNEGIKGDILQFGEILQFMLDNSRRSSDPIAAQGANDATEELRELVARIQKGSFLSIYRLWQILQQIFERTLPSSPGRPDTPRLNL